MAAVRRLPWEIQGVLALIVLDGIAVVATYARVPAAELYHVHTPGRSPPASGESSLRSTSRSRSSG
jgi:hypothetical protein